MIEDPYKAPEAELLNDDEGQLPEFYVVSVTKFSLLFILTTGLYALYWFYRNWRLYKEKHQENIWPAPRALFSIFFTHRLFEYVDVRLRNLEAAYKWRPDLWATLYVVMSIVSYIAERLSAKEIGSPYTDLLGLLLLPFLYWSLLQAQKAINVAVGDPQGQTNSEYTIYNWLWMLFGGFIWVAAIFGILIIVGAIQV